MREIKKLVVLLVCFLPPHLAMSQELKSKVFQIEPSVGIVKNSSLPAKPYKGPMPQKKKAVSFDSQIIDSKNEFETSEKSGIAVEIGVNFGANNMSDRNPPDNTMAISNDGFIISADNRQVDYYRDNGDTIIQYDQDYSDFYQFSGFKLKGIYDPRVIYDRYSDRFIFVSMDHAESDSSCLFISFSTNNAPSSNTDWNHYYLSIDSTHLDGAFNYWYDYINIGINKDELYVTTNVFDYNTFNFESDFIGNAIWQINKQNGYNNIALNGRNYADLTTLEGNLAFGLVPLSESLQSDSYNNGCYFVSTESTGSNKLNWFQLPFNMTNGFVTIIPHQLVTTPYSTVAYCSQPGGFIGDRIDGSDCRIQNGFYQNGKLHFTYTTNNASWSQIVYSKIKILDNTEERELWGITNKNYMYPSIASFSNDTLIEDIMMSFLRVGPSEYPQVCAVNYQDSWSSSSTIVKLGDGILNFFNDVTPPVDSLERLGDYTTIQRRYNQKACWLVGCYAYGNVPNLGLDPNGLNAWIAEIRSKDLGLADGKINNLNIFPNPVEKEMPLYISDLDFNQIESILVEDLQGREIGILLNQNQVELVSAKTGAYIILLKTKQNEQYVTKILVY